jgi:hypothetical protein
MPSTGAQVKPGSHRFCEATPLPQQGCPVPPQSWQLPVRPTPPPTHAYPSTQVCALPILQHGSLAPPQAEHVVIPARQLTREAVHDEASQHG